MQSTVRTQDGEATREMPPIAPTESQPPPPAPALTAPQGDACPKCSSLMAADQRYCIECGERRGEPRLPFMDGRTVAPAVAPSAQFATPPPGYGGTPPVQPDRRSAGIALVGTVGLLLLAMGVGVMIGNEDDGSNNALAQQPVVIGGSMAGATAPTGATGTAAEATSKNAAAAAAPEDQAGVNADEVAKKNGVKLAPKDVEVGDKCEKGSVGCEDGEFTGDYFGE